MPLQSKEIVILFFELRAKGLTSAVVLSLFIHTKGIPYRRAEDILLGDVMHADGDAKHRAQRDQVDALQTELFALLEEQAFIQGARLGGNLIREIFMDGV